MDNFDLNERDENTKNYYYTELHCHAFNNIKINGKNIFQCQPRKRNFNAIAPMYSLNPSQVKLFHLRLLLLSVKGAKNF